MTPLHRCNQGRDGEKEGKGRKKNALLVKIALQVVLSLPPLDPLLQQQSDLSIAEAAARNGEHEVEQVAPLADVEDVQSVGGRAWRLGRSLEVGERDTEGLAVLTHSSDERAMRRSARVFTRERGTRRSRTDRDVHVRLSSNMQSDARKGSDVLKGRCLEAHQGMRSSVVSEVQPVLAEVVREPALVELALSELEDERVIGVLFPERFDPANEVVGEGLRCGCGRTEWQGEDRGNVVGQTSGRQRKAKGGGDTHAAKGR